MRKARVDTGMSVAGALGTETPDRFRMLLLAALQVVSLAGFQATLVGRIEATLRARRVPESG